MVELIVEDGTIVPDANSYVSVDDIIKYAEARGVVLIPGSPIDPVKVAIMAINAMDYIEMFKYRWKGKRVNPSLQRLSWPREGVVIDGERWPSDKIPDELIAAQCQLCIQISRGVNLLPTVSADEAFITKEKVGPIETEYSEAVRLAASNLPVMPAVDALLAVLLDGALGRLRTVRI